ncbi:MAG: T9SS type A sorting domain-containing protein [Bacteroidetes bacterium]|nr:T9SS type A sorting domain-containing protein [Bacteroidota bacterium]
MKKYLLSLSLLVLVAFANAQSIPNGNFENWNTASWDELDTAETSAFQGHFLSGSSNASKTTDKVSGNYAIKLETQIVGQDTNFGYFIFGMAEDGLTGGFPYTQTPTSITGSYKYNIQTGDTALLLVLFKKNGLEVGGGIYKIAGVQNSYTTFSFPLAYTQAPDSVIIAATSSLPEDFYTVPTAKNGSWIQFDNIQFAGTSITQQVPNTDFEQWTTVSIEDPTSWSSGFMNSFSYVAEGAPFVEKTTDKYKGNYALKMTTRHSTSSFGFYEMMNGNPFSGRPSFPYTTQFDSLIFYYKYMPVGSDSATVVAAASKLTNYVGVVFAYLDSTSTYKRMSFPLNCAMVPDSLFINILSSHTPDSTNNGSVLIIDEIHMKSQPLATSIEKHAGWAKANVFPNPASNFTNIVVDLKESASVNIVVTDIAGKIVFEKPYSSMNLGKNSIYLNVSDFAKGVYNYSLKSNDGANVAQGKFIVE